MSQAFFRSRLYIPHGSDESDAVAEVLQETISFISHMVQMKDGIVMPQQTVQNLYIPHGSDESEKA